MKGVLLLLASLTIVAVPPAEAQDDQSARIEELELKYDSTKTAYASANSLWEELDSARATIDPDDIRRRGRLALDLEQAERMIRSSEIAYREAGEDLVNVLSMQTDMLFEQLDSPQLDSARRALLQERYDEIRDRLQELDRELGAFRAEEFQIGARREDEPAVPPAWRPSEDDDVATLRNKASLLESRAASREEIIEGIDIWIGREERKIRHDQARADRDIRRDQFGDQAPPVGVSSGLSDRVDLTRLSPAELLEELIQTRSWHQERLEALNEAAAEARELAARGRP